MSSLKEIQRVWPEGGEKVDMVLIVELTSVWSLKKAREFQKNIYLCFIQSLWLCGSQQTLENWEYQMGILDQQTCLLRNRYAGQEATVRTGQGTTNWFQIGKGVRQVCILSPCLFNLYAEYIMRNVGLDEAQAGIKIAGRNINNLRYADDITLWQKAKKNKRASWWKWKRRVRKLA